MKPIKLEETFPKEVSIHIKKLSKSFDNEVVLKEISFSAKKGDFITFFGPNGSGKTTILNIISKILKEDPKNSAEILLNYDNYDLSYVFQNYRDSLFPWKTNYDNIAFPLKIKGYSNKKIEKKISEIKKLFNFKDDLNKYPYELSGGQQQIIAFMRALVSEPKILLIDEPFSALDYETNLKLRKNIQKYYMKYKPLIILITHDIEEATHLSKKIYLLSKKPSKIISVFENKAKYPRKTDFLKSEEYHKLNNLILSTFVKEIKNEN